MGQKVNPNGFRLGVVNDWDAKWYADDTFADSLHEDLAVREYIAAQLADASVARVEIERAANRLNVSVHTARPGMVIGKGGSEVDALRVALNNLTGKRVHVNVVEIKNADKSAQLVANNIAEQLENRISFRRAQKQVIQRAMRAGVKGIKTQVAGRLNGADMARTEGFSQGSVPLHTLRADVEFATAEADTTYGKIGVKVWINHGEVLPELKEDNQGKGGN